MREKREVNNMALALSSLFKSDVLQKFNTEMDSVILDSDRWLEKPPEFNSIGKVKTNLSTPSAVRHTVNQLNKLFDQSAWNAAMPTKTGTGKASKFRRGK